MRSAGMRGSALAGIIAAVAAVGSNAGAAAVVPERGWRPQRQGPPHLVQARRNAAEAKRERRRDRNLRNAWREIEGQPRHLIERGFGYRAARGARA